MGNLLAECQRVSIGRCELCTEVLNSRGGARQDSNGGGTSTGARAGARPSQDQLDLTNMSEAEMMAHALRLSAMEHDQVQRRMGVTADTRGGQDTAVGSNGRQTEEDRL